MKIPQPLVLAFLAASPALGDVVINEIHYAPNPENEPVEFVELLNNGAEAVDLEGWAFTDGFDFSFGAGANLGPGAYLVVAQNASAYNTKFGSIFVGGVKASGEFLAGTLSDGGEKITLRDASGAVQDVVEYGDSFPWPTAAGGEGASMELVHPALDNNLGGSWRSSSAPTPGKQNSVYAEAVPPQVRQVSHTPSEPKPGEDVVVTARVSDPDGMGAVNLRYQLVAPGKYIAFEDAEYESTWTEVPMTDDGVAPDTIADDGVYTGTLPGDLQKHRHLMRYRLTAADRLGTEVRVPYDDDEAPNFAYFTYGDMPAWKAAVQPGETEEVTYTPELLQTVPVYQLITKKQDHQDAQSIPGAKGASYAGSDYLWAGTLVYDGTVYDHIHYRARGGVWRYAMGKNMWKFKLNRGHEFEARDDYGKKYNTRWNRINFSAIIQQGDFRHRGEQGLFEGVGFDLFRMAGLAAPHTHYLHFRIVENAGESNLFNNQYDTDFQGLYLAIEQHGNRLLRGQGFPEGNVFKMEGGTGPAGVGGEQKSVGPYPSVNDYSDLRAFKNDGYERAGKDEAWYREHMDLPMYYSYRSVLEAIHHYDTGAGKNYFFYLNPVSNKWMTLPWDLDLTWDDGMYSTGTPEPFATRVLAIDPLEVEYHNRLREVLDLLYNPEQTGMLIDQKAAVVYTPGEPSLVDADRAMWDYNPIMRSNKVNSSKSGQGRYYGIADPKTFQGMIDRMKRYIVNRSAWIETTILRGVQFPSAPKVSYVGAAGYALDDLRFESGAFKGGTIFAPQEFAAMKWRLAEVSDPSAADFTREGPHSYEINSAWESTEMSTFEAGIQIPAEVVKPGRTYRVRARFKNTFGYWGPWSDPVQFVSGAPDLTAYRDGLVISEILFAPAEATPEETALGYVTEDFEYIELMNVGEGPLDLTNIRFTKGIDYDFINASKTTLAAGERALLVRNLAAFEARNGTGLPVIGAYGQPEGGNKLDNNGENVKLAFASGIAIREFDYGSQGWPEVPVGQSLELINPSEVSTHDEPTSWQASAMIGGTPGGEGGGGTEPAAPEQRYAQWSALAFPADYPVTEAMAIDADADHDGWNTMEEYAFGGYPLIGDSRPAVILWEGGKYLLKVTRQVNAVDIVYQLESSNDLSDWKTESRPSSAGEERVLGTRLVTYDLGEDPVPYWRLRATLTR